MTSLYSKFANLFLFYKHLIVIFVCGTLFLIAPLTKMSLIPSFTDEIILFVILVYALFKSGTDAIVKNILYLYFLLFFLFVVMSFAVFSSRGLLPILLQVFIHLKYMMFFIFCWSFLGPTNSLKLAYFILGITIVFLVLNILSGSLFNDLLDTKVNLRSGGARPIGIQADTGSLGITFALIGCLVVSGLKASNRALKVAILLGMTILILAASTRTGLILIPLIVMWWLRDSIKSFVIAIVLLISSAIFIQTSDYMDELIEITVDNIEWTIDDPVASSYIRGIMIYFAFDLAIDRFPLGTGAATYGTVMSDNSAVYAEIGLQNSRYFVEKDGIYDSNFASILGEFGFIGLALFFTAFNKVLKLPMRKSELYSSKKEFRFVLLMLVIAYGITTPIFMNTYPAFILALVSVASYYHEPKTIKNLTSS